MDLEDSLVESIFQVLSKGWRVGRKLCRWFLDYTQTSSAEV